MIVVKADQMVPGSYMKEGMVAMTTTASPRVTRLRNLMREIQPGVCVERARLFTQSYRETEAEPTVIRKAKALAKVLNHMTIYITDGELIVGNLASRPRWAPVFPETAAVWVMEQLDTFERREKYRFEVPEEVKRELREEILPYWRGKTVQERALAILPPETKEVFQQEYPVISPTLYLRNSVGHLNVDYPKVLRVGFAGICQEIEEREKALDLTEPNALAKLQFYQAGKIVAKAAVDFAHRFAEEARRQAEKTEDHKRRRELERIAEICRWVPEHPARTFHEALQAFWFVHLLVHIETDGLAESPGRFDQYMYPYLARDLDRGLITEEEAQELLDCLWVKFGELIKLADVPPATKYFGGVTMSQNLILGGVDKQGRDATNKLSYMCLTAEKHVRLDQPALSIRIHQGTPEEFLRAAAEVIRLGDGKPAIFNDEVIIPGLLSDGVSLEDALDYVIIGCVEPAPPYNCNGWTNAAMFNMPKCLELALNQGVCRLSGKQVGPATPPPEAMSSIDDVIAAYRTQIAYFVRHMVIMLNTWDIVQAEVNPTPFASIVTDGCIENGLDMTLGSAKYNFTGPQGIGLADVADSLAAIKRLIYEDKALTWDRLKAALDNNFQGYELVRHQLLNKAPKYGNDDDYADDLARLVGEIYCQEVKKYKNPRGGVYRPGLYPVASNVPLGRVVGALPSGRLAGTPLADGISPCHGSDRLGPTAVLKSVSKVPHVLATNGTLLNLKLQADTIAGEEGLQRLCNFIRAFCSLKLNHIQFNTVSAETLRKAQANPHEYRNLLVRVAGYSAFFVEINRDLQDDIIDRTEHAL
ncbi:MAG: hypothetical protein PWP12_841 [Bacillota bacterium]|nr:hypothetical protein [Bacillota bacterium]MDK2960657.1 hypothetical protein [Bacillota bacterium]